MRITNTSQHFPIMFSGRLYFQQPPFIRRFDWLAFQLGSHKELFRTAFSAKVVNLFFIIYTYIDAYLSSLITSRFSPSEKPRANKLFALGLPLEREMAAPFDAIMRANSAE